MVNYRKNKMYLFRFECNGVKRVLYFEMQHSCLWVKVNVSYWRGHTNQSRLLNYLFQMGPKLQAELFVRGQEQTQLSQFVYHNEILASASLHHQLQAETEHAEVDDLLVFKTNWFFKESLLGTNLKFGYLIGWLKNEAIALFDLLVGFIRQYETNVLDYCGLAKLYVFYYSLIFQFYYYKFILENNYELVLTVSLDSHKIFVLSQLGRVLPSKKLSSFDLIWFIANEQRVEIQGTMLDGLVENKLGCFHWLSVGSHQFRINHVNTGPRRSKNAERLRLKIERSWYHINYNLYLITLNYFIYLLKNK